MESGPWVSSSCCCDTLILLSIRKCVFVVHYLFFSYRRIRCGSFVGMEEEVQQLRERAVSHSAPGGAASVSSGTASDAPPVVTKRLVVIPRDRLSS